MFQLGPAAAVVAALAITPAPGPFPEDDSDHSVAAVAIFFGDSLSMGLLPGAAPNAPGVNPVLNDPTIQANGAWVESNNTRYDDPPNPDFMAGMAPSQPWYPVDDTQGVNFVSASPVFGFATQIRATIDQNKAEQPDEIFCIQLGIGSSHAALDAMGNNSPFSWNPGAVTTSNGMNGYDSIAMFDMLVDFHVRTSVNNLLANFDEVQLIGVFGSCGGAYIQGSANVNWLAQYEGHMNDIREGFGALFNLSPTETDSFPMGLFLWHDANTMTFPQVLQNKLRIVQNQWANKGGENDFLAKLNLVNGLTPDGVHFTESTSISAGVHWVFALEAHWNPVPITSIN